ncbi:fimbrial biogenesis chaperone [Aurantiacibacter hainanensis]|uniref:fimbrial biogenesis chaperone n=1 Tax=Aurantiacibacter hainanensis TaxID=3076114 RepID=UPI0030C685A9
MGLLLAPAVAQAARVTPMVLVLDETGRGATGRIEVANTGDEPVPFEVLMFRGEITEEGELSLEPADEDFLVFPPQVVIEPLRQQIFRIQYIGEDPLETSEIFYASIREVPVARERTGVNLQIVSTFNVLINVVPEGAEPEPSHTVLGVEDREGQPGIIVRVANTGSRFIAAGRLNWSIEGRTGTGNTYERQYRSAEIGSVIGYGVVPAGGARRFFIPTPELLEAETLRVEIGS